MNEYNGKEFSDEFFEFITKAIKDDDYRHDTHEASCEHAEEMAIHIFGKKPVELLEIARPNEDPAIKTYRLEVYQPKTKSTANKALSIVSKIFNPSLFSIKWNEQSAHGKDLEKYCLEDYPVFNSILVYLQEAALAKMISDPNGVMVVRPKRLDIPDTARAMPVVLMYGSENIWYLQDDACLILKKAEEEKPTKYYYFQFYDNTFIVDFTVVKQTNGTFEITEELRYSHGCKTMPVWQLRGTPEAQDDGTIIYKSFFEPAIPYWNDAICHESDLKGAFINHVHPLRYEYDEECNFVHGGQQCNRGFIRNPDGESIQCPSCNGTGYKGAANSPYRIIRINRNNQFQGQDTAGFPVPAGFIESPTEPVDLLDKYVDKQHERGLYALNMDVVDKVGENQSGVAKVIDRGELYDFLSRISTVIFDVHLTNIFYYFNGLMFGVQDKDKAETNLPTVVKPAQFDISSTYELIDQLAKAKEAGLNPNYCKAAQNEIIEKKFTDPHTRQIIKLELENDPLPDYTVDEITALQMNGSYTDIDVAIHFNISKYIKRALTEQGDKFSEMDATAKRQLLEGYAKETLKATKTQIKPPEPPPAP